MGKSRFPMALAPLFLAGMFFCTDAGDQAVATEPNAYPNVEIRQNTSQTLVFCDSQLIVELKDNRFMRFRSTPRDEMWVGKEGGGADLCWAYADAKAKGMVVLNADHKNEPDRGRFTLTVKGKKPSFDSSIDVVLTGIWMPGVRKFRYVFSTRLECPLETWYQNSSVAQGTYRKDPKSRSDIEIIDYHIQYVSLHTLINSVNRKEPLMYQWFVGSEDGATWLKWPKVYIPFPTRKGNYITISDRKRLTPEGGYHGFLDSDHGGWMLKVIKTPAPIEHGLCWLAMDVHTNAYGAVPPRGSAERMSLEFEAEFEPVEPERSRSIIGKAAEVPWRTLDEYKLPLFSNFNRFDQLISDLPGEDTGKHYPWWASSFDCFRDNSTGFDDNYSASIKREKDSPIPDTWSIAAWGGPYDGAKIKGRRFRLSAMVKTSACTGQVRVGHAYTKLDNIFFRPDRTHNPDGSPKTEGVTWEFSDSLTGTNDWTPLSVEFVATEVSKHLLFLEQNGTGQSWFDNVRIEDLGEAQTGSKDRLRTSNEQQVGGNACVGKLARQKGL